jgi:phospholipase/carboxylesterase
LGIYIKKPEAAAKACVIWMHGLGADAKDMMGVADAFPSNMAISHVFIDAPVRPVTINNNIPMRAWYNIIGLKLTDREDKHGILDAEKIINEVVATQVKEGFTSQQIFLAGFSQGGAMALFTGLRSAQKLGGIISLSSYLPLISECENTKHTSTPIFMAMGEQDPVVLPAWTRKSFDWLSLKTFKKITWKQYPMEHSICIEEIKDIVNWLTEQVSLDLVK